MKAFVLGKEVGIEGRVTLCGIIYAENVATAATQIESSMIEGGVLDLLNEPNRHNDSLSYVKWWLKEVPVITSRPSSMLEKSRG